MTAVGVVGLGAMGSRLAGRLLDAGHQVVGTNRTREKAEPLIARGLDWKQTPREVAEAAEVVLSMVTDGPALEAVAPGPDGILAGLRPGSIWIDMSTVDPQTSRALAAAAKARGAELLDAPVSGSVPAAEAGTLTIMVGGDEQTFRSVESLLHELGTSVTYIGENGQALLLKFAINANLAVQMLAFAEGVLLAERGGIDRKLAVEVMSNSAIGSPMLQARAPLVLDLPEQGWFDVRLMQKDLLLALAAARELMVPLQTAAVTNELLTTARALGYGTRDIAALHQVLAHVAGGANG
jgi:3-hydroxyisobutyrate dehydrogenase-like beta-hydroxyacid dehydrogenase